jgi:hypothetical protein
VKDNWLFTDHLMLRLRERWQDCCRYSDDELQQMLIPQLQQAKEEGKTALTPGGLYIPFSLMGVDGYVVETDGELATVMPATWCEEVQEQLRSM